MATSKEILDDIHSVDPVPSGKINNKSKKLSSNKVLDSNLTKDQFEAAQFLYELMTSCFNIKGKQLYSSAENSKALGSLTEAEDKSSDNTLTKKDLVFKNFSYKLLNNPDTDYVYASQILEAFCFDVSKLRKVSDVQVEQGLTDKKLFGVIRNKEDQTAFIRSANHSKSILDKNTDMSYDAITKISGYKSFKKLFPDVSSNYENDHFNSDVNHGTDLYVVNAFIGLLNKSIKIKDDTGAVIGKFAIKSINIPKDRVDPDTEAKIQAGQKTLGAVVQSAIRNFISTAVRNLRRENISFTDVARILRESTQEIDNDWIIKAAEKNPNFSGKTFNDLENEWKTEHFKKTDKRDNDFLIGLNNELKSNGILLKKYFDTKSEKELELFFDVISRQIYLSTDGKMTLDIWDGKQDNLCDMNFKPFSNYINNVEPGNRYQDEIDLDKYNEARTASGIDDLVHQLRNLEAAKAKDKYGNEMVNVQDFERDFPATCQPQELSRIVTLIANSQPNTYVYINEELGTVIATPQAVNDLKGILPNLVTEIKNKVFIYQILNTIPKGSI